jgi:hypothetical protein
MLSQVNMRKIRYVLFRYIDDSFFITGSTLEVLKPDSPHLAKKLYEISRDFNVS